MRNAAFEDSGDRHEILVGRVGAASQADLLYGDAGERPDRRDVVGAVRFGCERLEPGQVDGHDAGVRCVGIGAQGNEVCLSVLQAQKPAGHLVAGKHGGRHAAFRAHVGDGGALRNAQRR